MFQKSILTCSVDKNSIMTKTVVKMLKEFMDKILAVQFVGAVLRKGNAKYVFVDTALFRAMKGK